VKRKKARKKVRKKEEKERKARTSQILSLFLKCGRRVIDTNARATWRHIQASHEQLMEGLEAIMLRPEAAVSQARTIHRRLVLNKQQKMTT